MVKNNEDQEQSKTEKPVKKHRKLRVRNASFSVWYLLVFSLVFAAVGAYALVKIFAYNAVTESAANGTVPNGYHTACIDPNNKTREFMHVNYCTSAEKADGWQNSSSWVWCADIDGSQQPAENNWINDGGCAPPSSSSSSSSSSGGGNPQNCSTPGTGPWAGETLQVCLSANPNTITTDDPTSLLKWQVNGSFNKCVKIMAPNSPNNDPFWSGSVGAVGSTNETYSQLGQYIPVIKCTDSNGNVLGHQYTTVELDQGGGGGGKACTATPTVLASQNQGVPAPVVNDTSATIYGIVNENAPPNDPSCQTVYYFDWGINKVPNQQSPSPPAIVSSPSDNKNHTVSVNLSGLNGGTTYYYYPCSYTKTPNGPGSEICGSQQSFTTSNSGGGGGCGINNHFLIKLATTCGGGNTYYNQYCNGNIPNGGSQTAANLLCNHFGSKANPLSFIDSNNNTEVYNQGDGTFTCRDNVDPTKKAGIYPDCSDIFDTLRGISILGTYCKASELSNNLLNLFNVLAANSFGKVGTFGLCTYVTNGEYTTGHRQGLAVNLVRTEDYNLQSGATTGTDYCNTKYWARRTANYLNGTLQVNNQYIPSFLVPNSFIADGVRGIEDTGDGACSLGPGSNPLPTYIIGSFRDTDIAKYRTSMMIDYSSTPPYPPPIAPATKIKNEAVYLACTSPCSTPTPQYFAAMNAAGTQGDYTDCSRFVDTVIRMTVDKNWPAQACTQNIWDYVTSHPSLYKIVTNSASSTSVMQPGDILMSSNTACGTSAHTEIYVGGGMGGDVRSASWHDHPPQPGTWTYDPLPRVIRYIGP